MRSYLAPPPRINLASAARALTSRERLTDGYSLWGCGLDDETSERQRGFPHLPRIRLENLRRRAYKHQSGTAASGGKSRTGRFQQQVETLPSICCQLHRFRERQVGPADGTSSIQRTQHASCYRPCRVNFGLRKWRVGIALDYPLSWRDGAEYIDVGVLPRTAIAYIQRDAVLHGEDEQTDGRRRAAPVAVVAPRQGRSACALGSLVAAHVVVAEDGLDMPSNGSRG